MKANSFTAPCLLLLLAWCATALAAEPLPEWIWSSAERQPNQTVCLQTQFHVGKQLRNARCLVTADVIRGNGHPILETRPERSPLPEEKSA